MSGALVGEAADLVTGSAAGAAASKATSGDSGDSGGKSSSGKRSGTTIVLPDAGNALGGNKALVGEFIICMFIWGCAPLLDQVDAPGTWLRKGAAVSGLFLVLALAGSSGPKAAKVSAAFGALVTFGLMINDRELFRRIVNIVTGTTDAGADQGGTGEGQPGQFIPINPDGTAGGN